MPLANENIAGWVESFQRGEEKGFTLFFNALYPAMFYYAFRIIKDKSAAAEIVEKCFVRVWEQHSIFNHHREIKSALYKCVYDECFECLNSEEEQEIDSFSHHAVHELIRTEVSREIHSAINQLPQHYRQVFKLIYIQGKSLTEVAEEL
ncbi:MAG: sigma-70 family RNA polymerase sigma factor, partial [Chitinophagaceae bacterium]